MYDRYKYMMHRQSTWYQTDQRSDLRVKLLPLKWRVWVRSPFVGSVSWLSFFSERKTNIRIFGPHSNPGIIWPSSSKIIFIHLWTAVVSDLTCSTWSSLNKKYQRVLPKLRSFTANAGTKAAVLHKGRSSTANSETKVAVLLGMNRCGSFPLLSAKNQSAN